VSQLGLEAGASWRKLDYSLTTDRDNTSNVAWIGGRYGGGGPAHSRLAGRYTKTDTPGYRPLLPLDLFPEGVLGPVEPDKADRKDLDFTVTWVASGSARSTLASATPRRTTPRPAPPDFDGITAT
jgi:hypothetical protein